MAEYQLLPTQTRPTDVELVGARVDAEARLQARDDRVADIDALLDVRESMYQAGVR